MDRLELVLGFAAAGVEWPSGLIYSYIHEVVVQSIPRSLGDHSERWFRRPGRANVSFFRMCMVGIALYENLRGIYPFGYLSFGTRVERIIE